MAYDFEMALDVATKLYPYRINSYEEYRDYFAFCYDDGVVYVGGDRSPVVIRKSDGEALGYAGIFFNLDINAPDVGEPLRVGFIPRNKEDWYYWEDEILFQRDGTRAQDDLYILPDGSSLMYEGNFESMILPDTE